MADIQLSDNVGNPVPGVKIDLSDPSSLVKYAKGELLHLAVAPDFVERAPLSLSKAAPEPLSFQIKLQHGFQLGKTNPEIDLTPAFQAAIRVNATADSNLFQKDLFQIPATVPEQTGYVSLSLQGGLDLGVSGSAGDLTFGFDATEAIALEYWKAFPLGGPGSPTLGNALGQTISRFVIPGDLDDLNRLDLNDVSTVSGQGSLTISRGFEVTAVPNPLASVNLPLNIGTVAVNAGPMVGISASFAISGAYQIRVRRIAADTLELSFCKQRGTLLKTDLSASAGVSITLGDTDLLKSLLKAISGDPEDTADTLLSDGLSKDEIATLTSAIKDGLDHSLQASLDFELAQLADDQAAFQYEVRPSQLDKIGSAAIHRALEGDLSSLTALENAGSVLSPGVKLISSVLTGVRGKSTTLRLNLLGLVNFVSVSALIRKCVVIKNPGVGDVIIADSETGNRINSEVQDMRRIQALRQAMFESLLITTTYRASKTINLTGVTSHSFHFEFSESTKTANVADYLNWLVAMNLLQEKDVQTYLKQFSGGGPSTCLLRTEFDDHACQAMFFQQPGLLWTRDRYLNIGRSVMRTLIDPNNSDVDRYRYELLDDAHWPKAASIGPNDNLGPLVGLRLGDSTGASITQFLIADVYTISWWATAMLVAGEAILDMQNFLSTANAVTLADNHDFAQRRDQLQRKMAAVISKSQTQFHEPWGLIALFQAAGWVGGSARLVAKGLNVQKP